MSITEPPFITRGKLRAAARALNQLADAEPRVVPEQVRAAFARAGVSPKPIKIPGEPPAEPYELPRDDDPRDDGQQNGLPPIRGPPEPQAIWARPQHAAALAGIGVTLLYRWIAAGRVISKKIGGVRLVLVASIHNIAADPVPTSRPGPRAHRKRAEQEAAAE
jgi:hypothetical protein